MGTKSGPCFQDSKAHEKAVSMEAVNVGPFLEARFGARFWGRILTFFLALSFPISHERCDELRSLFFRVGV
jgi:hypothetical protein